MLTKKVPYIRVFKLFTGEEIITKVVKECSGYYEIDKPLQPMQSEKGLTLVPYMYLADPEKVKHLYYISILMDSDPTSKLEQVYEQLTTGIAVPEKKSIITGL